jgi:hypothetical protein
MREIGGQYHGTNAQTISTHFHIQVKEKERETHPQIEESMQRRQMINQFRIQGQAHQGLPEV